MAQLKIFQEILDKLDQVLAILGDEDERAPAVTKEQLMAINGIGEAKADEIMKLLKGS